jgi:SulP family sulfate permease
MGLGIVLFMAMGLDASSGALAGLIGASVLLLISGGLGATVGMMSAPNGPMTMLLVGVMSSMAHSGASSDLLVMTLGAILVITGLLQVVFSLVGGTQLIKFIPFPVVAGLVSGVGLLMIKSQWTLLAKGFDGIVPLTLQAGYPLLIAILTAASMFIVPRLTQKRVPGAVGGLVIGIALYYILYTLLPITTEQSWVVGAIPSVRDIHFGFSMDSLHLLPLKTVVLSALALMVLGTTDSLVTSLVADSKTKERHNSKKEIVAQGVAEMVIGFIGGLGGWGTKGATLVAIDAGGRRWSAVVAGIFFILLMLFAGFAGSYLPVSVLAGIVAMVGVGMIDKNIISWMRYKQTRLDATIALLVITTIVSFNLVTAVGIGVLISILLFVSRQTQSPIVHRRVTGKEFHSFCARSHEAKKLLDVYGDTIVLYELKGDLFFATADKLRTQITDEMREKKIIILHFRRVKYIDMSAMIVLLQISQEALDKGCELIFSHLHKGLGFGKKASKAFTRVDSQQKFTNRVFIDTDKALEYAENLLLEQQGYVPLPIDKEITIEENDFCFTMTAEQKVLILKVGHFHSLPKKSVLFKQGAEGNSLFLLLKGELEIRLYSSEFEYKRLAKYNAGTYFGEVSFINPGRRVGEAVILEDVKLYEISRDDFLRLGEKEQARLALALLMEIGSTLSTELRRSALDIQRLEQW